MFQFSVFSFKADDKSNPEAAKSNLERDTFIASAYQALATLYDPNHLNDMKRFDMYCMLWMRMYGKLSLDSRTTDEAHSKYIGLKALFESYGQSMLAGIKNLIREVKRSRRRGGQPSQREKRMHADIRRIRGKADHCLLAQALAEYDNEPRLFSSLLSQYKEMKNRLGNTFTTFDHLCLKPAEDKDSKSPKDGQDGPAPKGTARVRPPRLLSNIFTKVKLSMEGSPGSGIYPSSGGSPCLMARQAISENELIFYEPVLTAKWLNEGEHCSQCNKQAFAKLPCDGCTRAVFCSTRCSAIAHRGDETVKRHHKMDCTKFVGGELKKIPYLVYHLITSTTDNPETFANALFGGKKEENVKPLKEVLSHLETIPSVHLALAAVLVCKKADVVNAEPKDEDADAKAWRNVEAVHLYAVLHRVYGKEGLGERKWVHALGKLVRFFEQSPEVYSSRDNPGARVSQGVSKIARVCISLHFPLQRDCPIGPFGGLLIPVCPPPPKQPPVPAQTGTGASANPPPAEPAQPVTPPPPTSQHPGPNTRRRFNSKTGQLEYIAKRKIEAGEVLTTSFPDAPKMDADASAPKPFMPSFPCGFCKLVATWKAPEAPKAPAVGDQQNTGTQQTTGIQQTTGTPANLPQR